MPIIDLPNDNRGATPGGTSALGVLGHRIRHLRLARGLTLAELGRRTGTTASQLSLVENGRREPRLSLLQSLAEALGTTTVDLLDSAPPSRRAALEVELDAAQASATYTDLGLPAVRPNRSMPTDVLEALVGLHREIARRDDAAIATPEEARRATTALRVWMRERNNYLPEIERVAEDLVRRAGYVTGALTHSAVERMAADLGFSLLHVDDLPHSTRTVTDLANGRIYLPPASIPGGHGLRSLALQAIAHRVLEHSTPRSYADFLRQRVEINYFAAACLVPMSTALAHLTDAKKRKALAVEDLRDAFGVTHEAAAWRLTNLLTEHLDIRLHFLRVADDGTLFKGYSNDGVRFPVDGTGAIEGQVVCRRWAARAAFTRRDRTTEYYQYTDTPEGTFWCTTQTGSTSAGGFSITVGLPFGSEKWFRGRDTATRRESRCPDPACCRQADPALAARWAGQAWPSAAVHAQILSPLPTGSFPGVEDAEVYAFLERHAARR